MFRAVLRTRAGAISLGILLLIVVLAAIGPLIAPFGAYERSGPMLTGPTPQNLFGTDYLGRDILSRLLVGARLSLFAAAVVLVVAFIIGVVPALMSVYSGRAFEWLSLRVMDTLITIPFLLFAIAATQLIGNGVMQAMIVLGIMVSPGFYRITRSATIAVGSTPYVEAAYLWGASTSFVLGRHVWRKVLPAIAIASANALAIGFIAISSLTYLGIGVQPPEPTWGGMLASDFSYLFQNPLAPIFPSIAIALTIGALNGLADAIRDVTGTEWRGSRRQRRTARKESPRAMTTEEESSVEERCLVEAAP